MYRVLIVDDEMPALRFVQSIIERFATNFQVAGVATSGEQGFQLLEQQMFDLLITDIGMRGMNGIERHAAEYSHRHHQRLREI